MSSSLLSAKLQKLIKKTSDIDKDERFMATSDLCQELANLDEANHSNQQTNAPATAVTSTHNRGATPAVTAPFNGLTAGQTTGPTLDSALQLLIARTIVTLLEDSSTDVQTVSVKCLAILCRRISSEQLVHIIDKLATLISDPSKSESRDIYAIGLKTMIQSVAVSGPNQLASNTTTATPAAGGAAQSGAPLLPDSPSIGVTMAHRILSGMSTGLKLAPQQGAEEIDITCTILDVIKDVLNKFGVYVTDMHESLLQSLTPRLESPHDSIRKRTISTLSSLVPNLSDQSFHSFLELIIAMLARHESQQSTVSDARAKQLESTLLYTYLQMVSVVSTTAGARIGKYLNKIVPQLEKFIKIPDKSSAASTSDDSHQMLELWEWTLSAFESLIIRCTQEVGPYLPNVIKRAEEFVKYDPNYMYYTEEEKPSSDVDMVDDTAAKGGDDDWGDDGGDDDGWGAGDDDDNGRLDDVDDDSDDGSWKVRRAAVKVLAAYIRSGTALDATLPSSAAATATDARTANFGRLCDLLLERLKERDQNVKIAIIQALQDLLRECALSEAEVNQPAATIINADAMSIDTPMSPSSSVSASPAIHLRSTLPPVLQERVPAIIEACVKQIKGGSFSETHHHIFSLLLDLSSATGGGLSPYLPTLVPLILQVMSSSSSSSTSSSSSVSSTVEMKMDGVGLLRALIDTHTPSGWFNQASPIDIQSVTSALILSFKDTPYIKYRVEVLHATASLITLLGRFKLEQRRQAHADYAAIVTPTLLHSIYSSLLYPTLQLHDVDQELKEQTLHSVGGMFYYFGKELNNLAPSALHDCMSILLTHRLTNELTRLASLRCLTRMTAAPVEDGFVLKIYDIVGTTVTNIGGTERRIVDEMISFLRKESQALKYEVVQAFIGIFDNNEQCLAPSNAQSTLLTPDQLSTLLKELSSHLSDSDLTLATGIFTLFTTIYRVFPSLTIESTTPTAGQDADGVLARVMAFMKSPLLQQQNIHPIVRLFQTIMQMSYRTKPVGASLSYNPHLTFQYLFDLFASQVASQGAAASNAFLAHVAQVVGGGLLLHVPSNEQSRMIQHLLNLIQAAPSAPSNGSESMKQFALLVLGELGRHVYLTALNSNLTEAIFFQCFTLESESIRLASSVAFGHVMMGNIAHFVPTILQQLQQPTISERKEMLTLILNSLKELIGNLTQSDVKPELVQSFRTFLPSLLPLLWSYASHREESVRSLVSDVIGGLVIIDSGITFPEMVRLLKADKPDTRSVVINALRYAIAQHGQQTSTTSSVAIDSNLLQQHLPSFLQLLRDPDLGVRRQAILTVSALVHSRSYAHHLLGPSFQSTILPILFQHLVKDPTLVRVVDLGPFKHKVDDGFPLRKAAYQTLDTLLDVHSPSLDAVSLLTHLSGGLSDHDDIVILVYQMLEKCAQRYPVQMSQVLDSLPGKMMDGVKEKLKLAKTVPADSSAASSTAPPTGAGAPTGDATTAERAKDVLRAAVRCCLALQAMPTVHQCPQFVEFFQRILKTKMLVEMIEEMKQQSYR